MKPRCLALAAVAALLLSACAGESDAHKEAREEAERQAGYYCTLGSSSSIHSEEYKTCVKDQAAVFLAEWEAEHPDE